MMDLGFGSFGGSGSIFMIIWWVIIIFGIVALVRWVVSGQSRNDGQNKSALEILKERYAKGEIDKNEFDEKKKNLV